MDANFDRAFLFVMKWEGESYECDPDDPGGATKYGISKKSYPNLKIKDLTKDQAKEIYRKDYWKRFGCDNQPFPFDIIMFDTAVNCGGSRANKWVTESPSPEEFLTHRCRHYIKLAMERVGLRKFLKGWLNRVSDLVLYINEG